MSNDFESIAKELAELRQQVDELRCPTPGAPSPATPATSAGDAAPAGGAAGLQEELERARFAADLAELKLDQREAAVERKEEALDSASSLARHLKKEVAAFEAIRKRQTAELRRLRSQLGIPNPEVEDGTAQGKDPLQVYRDASQELASTFRSEIAAQRLAQNNHLGAIREAVGEAKTGFSAKSKRHWAGILTSLEKQVEKIAGEARKAAAKAEQNVLARAEGSLDEVSERRISGWAWNPKVPAERLLVQLCADGEVLSTAYADIERADLEKAGVGDACFGFRFTPPEHLFDGQERDLSIEVPGYENRLNNNPRRATFSAAGRAGAKAAGASKVDPEDLPKVPAHLAAALVREAPNWGTVSIIIPIYNAAADLRRCLISLLAHTTTAHEIVLVDDCSPDPEVAEVMGEFADHPQVRCLRTPENKGFVGAVNHGLANTGDNDIVLLNSDTEVPQRWLLRLRAAASSDARIATATPVTNAGGAFSIPEYGKDAPLPADLDTAAAARVVARSSGFSYPEIPTGNGFCLYIKRTALNEVGGELDEDTFGRGYGEENDLCMRMRARGWTHVLDDASFVFHKGHASFQEESEVQLDTNLKLLYDRYPEYRALVSEAFGSDAMKDARARICDAWDAPAPCRRSHRRRVLLVLHGGQGGVMGSAEDIAAGLPDHWERFLLTSDGSKLCLHRFVDDKIEDLHEWPLPGRWSALKFESAPWAEAYAAVLLGLDIDLVHIHHLFKHTFDLPRLCRQLDVPYLLSLHDFYFINPSLQLLDTAGNFCADNTPADGEGWEVPSPMLGDLPFDDPGFQSLWRERALEVLSGAAHTIAPSEVTRQIHLDNFPELAPDRQHAVEHGRDYPFRAQVPVVNTLAAGDKVRVLCLGSLDDHKGAQLLKEIKALDRNEQLDLHFLGPENPKLLKAGEQHGPYARHEVIEKAAEIAPAFAVVLSIWGETFSYTLSECWACGIPVLVGPHGAPAERIGAAGGGWVTPDLDPGAVFGHMLKIGSDRDDLQKKRDQISAMAPISIEEMALHYDELYHQTLSDEPRPAPRHKLAVFTPVGDAASTFIRTFLPLDHPAGRGAFQPHYLDPENIDADQLAAYLGRNAIGSVLVQRAPLDAENAAALLAAADKAGTPITIDLDDDLFQVADTHPDAREYRESVDALRGISKKASRLTTSTPALAEELSWTKIPSIEVVPNRLDERLWAAALAPGGRPKARKPGRPAIAGQFTVGYFGTFTHADDLDLIREALDLARTELGKKGIKLRFQVAGGARQEKGKEWFEPLPLPKANAYPDFVSWLRKAALGWDLGIAPLADTPLNRSKSALKLLEYTALGIPTLCSAVGEYAEVAAPDQLIPAAATPADWAKAIIALATGGEVPETSKKVAGRLTMRSSSS